MGITFLLLHEQVILLELLEDLVDVLDAFSREAEVVQDAVDVEDDEAVQHVSEGVAHEVRDENRGAVCQTMGVTRYLY